MGFVAVQAGQCISTLAQIHHTVINKIADAPQNRELIQRRGNLSMLLPGDRIFVPASTPKEADGPTSSKYAATLQGQEQLRIKLLDGHNQPLAGVDYHYVLDETPAGEHTTADDGLMEVALPRHIKRVQLVLPWQTVDVALSHLAPANTVSGVQMRLHHLGYDPGPVTGTVNHRTQQALLAFQTELEDFSGTRGSLDDASIHALRALHDEETLTAQEALDDTPPEDETVTISEADVSVAASLADDLDDDLASPSAHGFDVQFMGLDPALMTWDDWLEIDAKDEPDEPDPSPPASRPLV